MKIAFLVFLVGLFAPLAHGLQDAKLIEDCYSAPDTDLSESPNASKIFVRIFLDERGFFAEIKNESLQSTIASKVPVHNSGTRGLGGWTYSTPASLWALPNGAANLEVYRTNQESRTPTGLNAHLTYANSSKGISRVKVDRLECRRLGL